MHARTYRQPGLVVIERTMDVPLDHADPHGEQIEVFAREVVAADKTADDLPWLVFLQGGPGFEAPRPVDRESEAWLDRALHDYRVLLLDQRGMGRSTPIGQDDARRLIPEALADRLAHHRADAIIRDAEAFREALGIGTWSLLGQSFGGFCVVAYLSAFPGSLREALITGGLPPLDRGIDEVYAETYRTSIAKSHSYYERYPEDRARVAELVEILDAEDVRLPSGDRLTSARLRGLGHHLGMGPGAERLHHILELPRRSPAFLHDVEASAPFARNPLYAVVHESCYAPGIATRWSAQRLRPSAYDDDPTLLTSEHIYPWMFDEMSGLAPFRGAAHLLAERAWGPLYDPEVLAANQVPVAAAVYADDMYVPRVFSEETAGRIQGLHMWLTNEYEHDGLKHRPVLDRLIALARGLV